MKTLTNNLKKAVIELLILKFLSEEDMYGYQITQEFKKRSNNRLSLLEGSMYPILYRLTEGGFISSFEQKVGKRQTRIYYHLEEYGKKKLEDMTKEFHETIQIIESILKDKGDEDIA